MRKRPIYQFNVDTELGLDKLPIGAFISVGTSTPKTYVLDNKTGILATTTIAQAVTGLNLREQASTIGGSVASADKLTTARTINGVPFDGTANINLPQVASLTSYTFTATEGQTVFTTTGTSLSATPLVFLNGALQQITATYTVLGLAVTFLEARVLNETIVIVG